MKKLIVSLTSTVLLATGCQTANHVDGLSQAGTASLTCESVYSAFNAYKADKSSADAWLELFKNISPELDAKAMLGERSPDELYKEATLYTNVALSVQGCKTL